MKPRLTALSLALLLASALNARADSPRSTLLDDQWKFSLAKFTLDDAAGPDSTAFKDTAWRTVDLPHDWSIEGPFDRTLASCTAFLPGGIGWYRKTLTLPADAKDKSISIRFDGVMNHSTVWCNGKLLGSRPYGYSSFTYSLTPALNFDGKPNVITVRVDHEQYADSRWYDGSGIYRNVFLTVTDKVHVDTNGVFVTTPQVTTDSAEVNVLSTIKNDLANAQSVQIDSAIVRLDGTNVGQKREFITIPAGGTKQISHTFTVPNPALWSPDHPNLYKAYVIVGRGESISPTKLPPVDSVDVPFGIRTVVFDPNKGLSINGQTTKLKGVCLHDDAGALGIAIPIEVWERRFKTLQEGGCNAIRCSHNPPDPEFLDLADRMGFLVMDEAFDEWTQGKHKWIVAHNQGTPGTDGYHSDFDKWADIDIRDMILRDRNHPSIILWSIGNEIDYQNDPFPPNSPLLPPIAARLIKDVKSVDTTRPVTAACAFPATNLFKTQLDVEGYNYMERLYAGDHAANPQRVMYGSENSHALAAWESVANNDYIAGQFLWTGIDYLGEAAAWPAHASPSGLLNLAGFKKNQYYFRQSLWIDSPMVYLSTTGLAGGGGRRGGGNTISCFTNCDSVELFEDGKSLGSKTLPANRIITWPVDFTAGTLKAVGKKGTKETTFELKHAGPAAKLALQSDVPALAPGNHLAQIEVDVTDKDGNLVTTAANLITCDLTGPARILGIENGNVSDLESPRSPTHTTYQGRMIIYVQSQKTPGGITLKITAPNLEPATLTIPVK